jgi:hypothetical protein
METNLLIAQALGVYFLVSGVFVATHQKTLGLLLNDFFKNRALLYVVGAFLVLGGALIVLRGDTSGGVSTFVLVMGWAILIKGALYIFSPQTLHKMVKPWSSSMLSLVGVTVAAVGAYLVFFLG